MKLRIGGVEIGVTGKDERDLIEQASFFNQLPCTCGNCNSKELAFMHSQPKDSKGNPCDYYFLRCKECGFEFKFGIRQSDERLFPKYSDADGSKNGWEPPYHKSESDRNRGRGGREDDRGGRRPAAAPRGRRDDPPDDEDIPF